MDIKEFRNALGCYATGVTVVTTVNGDGAPVGLTVNSFTSVSLEPPLVSWCLAKSSTALDVFADATHFAVNILSTDQQDLSNTFASKGEDKFAGIEWTKGTGDAPLFPDCAARLECRVHARHDAGDHVMILGEVLNFDLSDRPGLVYYRGGYATAQ